MSGDNEGRTRSPLYLPSDETSSEYDTDEVYYEDEHGNVIERESRNAQPGTRNYHEVGLYYGPEESDDDSEVPDDGDEGHDGDSDDGHDDDDEHDGDDEQDDDDDDDHDSDDEQDDDYEPDGDDDHDEQDSDDEQDDDDDITETTSAAAHDAATTEK